AGGAIYARANAKIVIAAENNNVIFNQNYAAGNQNDIHLIDSANIEFSAEQGRKITINGGISGGYYANALISKKGLGDLIFDSGAAVDYKSYFNIEEGFVKAPMDISSISFLSISSSGKLSIASDSANFSIPNKLYIESATISGIFEIGLNLSILSSQTVFANAPETDMLFATDDIRINAGSSLTVNIFNLWQSTGMVKIMHSDTKIYDWYKLYVDDRYYELSSSPDDRNLFLTMFASPMQNNPVIIINSKFFANALSMSAKSHGLDYIYSRLEPAAELDADSEPDADVKQKGSAWAGLYASGETIDKFSVNSFGAAFGADIYTREKLTVGIFARYGINNIKEDEDKGTMSDIEIGLYGGCFDIYHGDRLEGTFNLKGNLSIGFQSWTIETQNDLAFDGNSFKSGVELEYVTLLTPTINIKPFIAVQGGFASNKEIKSDTMTIDADSFIRLEAKIGAGFDGKFEEMQNITWYGRLYGVILASGDSVKYKTKTASGESGDISASEEGSIGIAIALGGKYVLSEKISININAGIDFGAGFGYAGGIGASYKF
ncbi:MAG: autotransporter outer membrane beta-barrel domain-containing protein, partial [Endomicrobium sp.]|nr:autotransporter outer membrane beta-barrel domain-containing protein [Endomicrobium sp.]